MCIAYNITHRSRQFCVAASKSGGFTLVELLAVFAVIAIIMAILAPALGAGKNKTQSVICINNLRQMQIAMINYSGDSNDMLPPNHDGFVTNENTRSWTIGNMMNPRERTNINLLMGATTAVLGKYIQNSLIYRCPADKSNNSRSYSLNGWINPVRESGPPRWLNESTNHFKVFRRLSDCTSLNKLVSFIQEDNSSINDGYFAVNAGGLVKRYVDIPHLGHGRRVFGACIDGSLVDCKIYGNLKTAGLINDSTLLREYDRFSSLFTEKVD